MLHKKVHVDVSLTAHAIDTLQKNVSVKEGTSFVSVQRVPPTTEALKQAVTMQPVAVGVDASDWSYYFSVGARRP